MTLSLAKLSLHPRARFRVLGGKAVIVHQECAEVIGLNRTGTLVIETLVAEKTMQDVVDRLHAETKAESEIPPASIERDVVAFIEVLIKRGVVVSAS